MIKKLHFSKWAVAAEMKKIFTLLLSICAVTMIFAQNIQDNYSIKGRWNVKAGVSMEKVPFYDDWGPYIDDIYLRPLRQPNVRFELNYGFTRWLELGLNAGWQNYIFNFVDLHKSYWIPTVGVNARVHLLPFFVKNQNCRWEWYLSAHYGGAFVINPENMLVKIDPNIVRDEDWYKKANRVYRQDYGIGMGGGVYFWNLFGLYAEVSFGNFSHFTENFNTIVSTRLGIQFKF